MPKSKDTSPFQRAIHYLSYRPRTEFEVRQHLGPDCTNELIAKLTSLKYIDDAAYITSYIDQRSRHSPRSLRLIAQELKHRGINLDARRYTLDAETELASRALQKKFKGNYTRLQAHRFLTSRGFGYQTIESVLKKGYNDDDVT